jgi:hypothetical protein
MKLENWVLKRVRLYTRTVAPMVGSYPIAAYQFYRWGESMGMPIADIS